MDGIDPSRPRCERCGLPLPPPGKRGPRRRFHDRCIRRAYRARRAPTTPTTPEEPTS